MTAFPGSYQGTPSGVPRQDRNMNGFSRCGAVGSEQGINPFSSAVTESLKRCPDTKLLKAAYPV